MVDDLLSAAIRRGHMDLIGHLAFGAGPHICLGMMLARRELEISLMRLVQRMPRLRLYEERPVRRRANSLVFRGLESLPVRFD